MSKHYPLYNKGADNHEIHGYYGASSGVGYGIALDFIEKRKNLILVARRENRLGEDFRKECHGIQKRFM